MAEVLLDAEEDGVLAQAVEDAPLGGRPELRLLGPGEEALDVHDDRFRRTVELAQSVDVGADRRGSGALLERPADGGADGLGSVLLEGDEFWIVEWGRRVRIGTRRTKLRCGHGGVTAKGNCRAGLARGT